jgi:hypothetical protein
MADAVDLTKPEQNTLYNSLVGQFTKAYAETDKTKRSALFNGIKPIVDASTLPTTLKEKIKQKAQSDVSGKGPKNDGNSTQPQQPKREDFISVYNADRGTLIELQSSLPGTPENKLGEKRSQLEKVFLRLKDKYATLQQDVADAEYVVNYFAQLGRVLKQPMEPVPLYDLPALVQGAPLPPANLYPPKEPESVPSGQLCHPSVLFMLRTVHALWVDKQLSTISKPYTFAHQVYDLLNPRFYDRVEMSDGMQWKLGHMLNADNFMLPLPPPQIVGGRLQGPECMTFGQELANAVQLLGRINIDAIRRIASQLRIVDAEDVAKGDVRPTPDRWYYVIKSAAPYAVTDKPIPGFHLAAYALDHIDQRMSALYARRGEKGDWFRFKPEDEVVQMGPDSGDDEVHAIAVSNSTVLQGLTSEVILPLVRAAAALVEDPATPSTPATRKEKFTKLKAEYEGAVPVLKSLPERVAKMRGMIQTQYTAIGRSFRDAQQLLDNAVKRLKYKVEELQKVVPGDKADTVHLDLVNALLDEIAKLRIASKLQLKFTQQTKDIAYEIAKLKERNVGTARLSEYVESAILEYKTAFITHPDTAQTLVGFLTEKASRRVPGTTAAPTETVEYAISMYLLATKDSVQDLVITLVSDRNVTLKKTLPFEFEQTATAFKESGITGGPSVDAVITNWKLGESATDKWDILAELAKVLTNMPTYNTALTTFRAGIPKRIQERIKALNAKDVRAIDNNDFKARLAGVVALLGQLEAMAKDYESRLQKWLDAQIVASFLERKTLHNTLEEMVEQIASEYKKVSETNWEGSVGAPAAAAALSADETAVIAKLSLHTFEAMLFFMSCIAFKDVIQKMNMSSEFYSLFMMDTPTTPEKAPAVKGIGPETCEFAADLMMLAGKKILSADKFVEREAVKYLRDMFEATRAQRTVPNDGTLTAMAQSLRGLLVSLETDTVTTPPKESFWKFFNQCDGFSLPTLLNKMGMSSLKDKVAEHKKVGVLVDLSKRGALNPVVKVNTATPDVLQVAQLDEVQSLLPPDSYYLSLPAGPSLDAMFAAYDDGNTGSAITLTSSADSKYDVLNAETFRRFGQPIVSVSLGRKSVIVPAPKSKNEYMFVKVEGTNEALKRNIFKPVTWTFFETEAPTTGFTAGVFKAKLKVARFMPVSIKARNGSSFAVYNAIGMKPDWTRFKGMTEATPATSLSYGDEIDTVLLRRAHVWTWDPEMPWIEVNNGGNIIHVGKEVTVTHPVEGTRKGKITGFLKDDDEKAGTYVFAME